MWIQLSRYCGYVSLPIKIKAVEVSNKDRMCGPERTDMDMNLWPQRQGPQVKITGKQAALQTSRKQQLFTGSQTFQITAQIQKHFKENWSGNGQVMKCNTAEISGNSEAEPLDTCVQVDHDQLFPHRKLLEAVCGKQSTKTIFCHDACVLLETWGMFK